MYELSDRLFSNSFEISEKQRILECRSFPISFLRIRFHHKNMTSDYQFLWVFKLMCRSQKLLKRFSGVDERRLSEKAINMSPLGSNYDSGT